MSFVPQERTIPTSEPRACRMSTSTISLPDLIRGLILESGISQQEVAIRSGVSPGSVAALCARTPKALLTWLQQLASLGCAIDATWQQRVFHLALPRIPPTAVEREWRAWRSRRMATTVNHLRHGETKAKRAHLDERAATYTANEEARLRLRFTELRTAAAQLDGRQRIDGMRAAVQLLADRIGGKAEELALLSGTSLSACQLVLHETSDGRLATMHRLLSALGASLEIILPAGCLTLNPCRPGEWRPGMTDIDRCDEFDDKPITLVHINHLPRNRSALSSDEMLALYDQEVSIGEIARQAGVSRQRVHQLAMGNGRPPRRQMTRATRVEQGRTTLGIG